MDKYHIHNMLEDITETASTELSKGVNQVNTKEMGEVIDMIKDLSEAEKNKMEACYYKSGMQSNPMVPFHRSLDHFQLFLFSTYE